MSAAPVNAARPANPAERKAFSDIFRVFEKYADTSKVVGREQEDAFFMQLGADLSKQAETDPLYKELAQALLVYFDRQITGKAA